MDTLDQDIIINLFTSRSFEELIEYADIVNLIHTHPEKFNDLITSAFDVCEQKFASHIWISKFIGYLLYKSIISNDTISTTYLRNSKYFDRDSLIELIDLAYYANNWDLILSNTWMINNNHNIPLLCEPILFVIEKYHCFDINYVWGYIRSSIILSTYNEFVTIINKCIEVQLPQLNTRIANICDSINNVPKIDFILLKKI